MIIMVLAMSFIVYFVFQAGYEKQIRITIFEEQKERQVAYAKSVADNIESDLNSIMKGLQAIALSKPIQDNLTTGNTANILLKQIYEESSSYSKIDGMLIIDENDDVVNTYIPLKDYPNVVALDVSKFPSVIESKKDMPNPSFSMGYKSPVDGTQRIALSYPVYVYQDTGRGEYMGSIIAMLDIRSFLSKYGNLDDVNSQYLSLIDRNWTVISSPFKDAVGRNFHEPILTKNSSKQAEAHFQKVLSGQSNLAVFNYRTGDRLNAGEPIFLWGKPTYFLFIATPTDAIYAKINSVISSQRTAFYLLQGVIIAAIGIASFFLTRSWTLEKAVKERTSELQVSNDKLVATHEELREANIQLKKHDQMQTEFINIAAHELRTPVQPIIGIMEILGPYPPKGKEEEKEEEVRVKMSDLRLLGRNAARLEHLSSDILDASRIESGLFRICNQEFDLNELVREAVANANSWFFSIERVQITSSSNHKQPINVVADRQRIMQVVTNLLNNAIRYSRPAGTVSVIIKKEEELDEVKVEIVDTGAGITQKMIQKLFMKFSSSIRDGSGTGLGLFISKAIIETHGGRIWGVNNPDGKGATFGFVIQINPKTKVAVVEELERTTINSTNADLLAMAKEAFEREEWH